MDADELLALAGSACAEVAPLPEAPHPGRPRCMASGADDESTLARARRCAVESPQEPGALRVLEVLGGAEDLDVLARAALVPNAGPTAAEVLARLDGREELLAVACRADPTAAGWALDALVRFEDPRVDALLLAHLVGERVPHDPLAIRAARALGRRGGEAVWTALDRFPDDHRLARLAFASDREGSASVAPFRPSTPGVARGFGAHHLPSSSMPAIEAPNPRAPAEGGRMGAEPASEAGPGNGKGPGVARLLSLPPAEVAALLVEERSPRAAEVLERLAADPDPAKRFHAGALAPQLGEEGRAVAAALLDDPDPAVRSAVAKALATHDGALEDLWRVAVDPDDPRRAVAALAKARSRAWVDPHDVDRRLLALAELDEARAALYASGAASGIYADEVAALARAERNVGALRDATQALAASDEGRAFLEGVAADVFDPRSPSARAALDRARPVRPIEVADGPPTPPEVPTADRAEVRRRARARGELGLLGVVGTPDDVARIARGLEDPATTRAAVDGLCALGTPAALAACSQACLPRTDGRFASDPFAAVADAQAVEHLASRPYGRARLVALEPTLSPELRLEVHRRLLTLHWYPLRPPDAVVGWARSAAVPHAIALLAGLGDAEPVVRGLARPESAGPVIEALRTVASLPPAGVEAVLAYLDRRYDRRLLEAAVGLPELHEGIGRRLLDGAWPEVAPAERGRLLRVTGAPIDADTAIHLASADPAQLGWLVGPIGDRDRVRAALLGLSSYRGYLLASDDPDAARLELLARPEAVARYAALEGIDRGPASPALVEAIAAVDDPQLERQVVEALAVLAPERALARIGEPTPDDLGVLRGIGTDDAAERATSLLASEAVGEHVARWLADRGGPVAERHREAIERLLTPSSTVVTP